MTGSWRQQFRHHFSAAMGMVMALTLLAPLQAGGAAAGVESRVDSRCAAMTNPVFQRINPRTSANLLTRSRSESIGLAHAGSATIVDCRSRPPRRPAPAWWPPTECGFPASATSSG